MTSENFKRFIFYFLSSFALATFGFYFLKAILPNSTIFGHLFRMRPYHLQFPIQFIFIPCFFFGIVATIFSSVFKKTLLSKGLLVSLIISTISILISLPFGGILWNYYDMQAGYFPENWFICLVSKGSLMGFSWGVLIIGLSIPYNLLGLLVSYFLTFVGSRYFR